MPKQMKLKLYGSGGNEHSKPTVRKLKVYYGSYHGNGNSRHPLIRIAGQYLRAYGFKTGDMVELKLSDGYIEISRLAQE